MSFELRDWLTRSLLGSLRRNSVTALYPTLVRATRMLSDRDRRERRSIGRKYQQVPISDNSKRHGQTFMWLKIAEMRKYSFMRATSF